MQNKKTKIDDFDPEADLVDCLPLLPQILARRSRRKESRPTDHSKGKAVRAQRVDCKKDRREAKG
jgi:hypothetical protein